MDVNLIKKSDTSIEGILQKDTVDKYGERYKWISKEQIISMLMPKCE